MPPKSDLGFGKTTCIKTKARKSAEVLDLTQAATPSPSLSIASFLVET